MSLISEACTEAAKEVLPEGLPRHHVDGGGPVEPRQVRGADNQGETPPAIFSFYLILVVASRLDGQLHPLSDDNGVVFGSVDRNIGVWFQFKGLRVLRSVM